MNREDALRKAIDLYNEKGDWDLVAKEMANHYTSKATGKPLAPGSWAAYCYARPEDVKPATTKTDVKACSTSDPMLAVRNSALNTLLVNFMLDIGRSNLGEADKRILYSCARGVSDIMS